MTSSLKRKRHYKKDTSYLYDLYTLTFDENETLESLDETVSTFLIQLMLFLRVCYFRSDYLFYICQIVAKVYIIIIIKIMQSAAYNIGNILIQNNITKGIVFACNMYIYKHKKHTQK